jgi:hypothetical protein
LTGTSTGGSAVTISNYEIYWDGGATMPIWVSLTLTSSLTFTQPVTTPGETYSFKIRGINKYGTGPFSSITAIIAG